MQTLLIQNAAKLEPLEGITTNPLLSPRGVGALQPVFLLHYPYSRKLLAFLCGIFIGQYFTCHVQIWCVLRGYVPIMSI